MTNSPSTSTLFFRAARASDHAAVVEMTRDIWGGDDYLADVWNEWVNAPNSHLRVGLLDGQLVVSGRLVALAKGEWWLEGMRVHPAQQGRGFSTQLHFHLVELATQQPGMRTLGLATSWRNEAIAHLARRSGMGQQGDYRMLKRVGTGQTHPDITVEEPSASLRQEILESAWGAQGGGYLMDGWVARRVTDEWLTALAARGDRIWRYGTAWALAGPDARRRRWWLRVLEGPPDEQGVLVHRIAQIAHEHTDGEPLRALVPDDEALIAPLVAASFGDPWGGERGPFHLYHFALNRA